jgi:glycosyltransferase involved in cell wall biosynthesis
LIDFPYNSFYRVAEDYDLFLRLAKFKFVFSFIKKSLSKYRKHDKSITKTKTKDFDYGILTRDTYHLKKVDFRDKSWESSISCVMPTKNRADMISQAIQSIIDQTFSNWELIIVDDHSDENDNTEEVVKSFDDKRIRYYKLPDGNGRGIACARNFGNMMAKADIIAVMDSDDVSYPFRFELTLKEFKEKNCDLVYGEIDYWNDETENTKKRDNEYYSRKFDLKTYQKLNFIPHSTVSYRKSMVLEFAYNSFFRRAEDYDLFLRLSRNEYHFSFIQSSLTKYRKHAGAVTKEKLKEFDYDNITRTNNFTKE